MKMVAWLVVFKRNRKTNTTRRFHVVDI